MAPVYEYTFRRHRVAELPSPVIRTPRDVVPVAEAMLKGRETEALVAVLLNTKNGVLGAVTVYTGNVSASLVRVGEVFRDAVRLNATALVIAHNHPSGDPTPSPDDLHLTAECLAAGRLLDIELLDSIIVTDEGGYVSLRERGVAFDRMPEGKA